MYVYVHMYFCVYVNTYTDMYTCTYTYIHTLAGQGDGRSGTSLEASGSGANGSQGGASVSGILHAPSHANPTAHAPQVTYGRVTYE